MAKDCLVTELRSIVNDPNLPVLGVLSFGFTQTTNKVVNIAAVSGNSITVKTTTGTFSVSGGSTGLTELVVTTQKELTFSSDATEFLVDNYYAIRYLFGNTLVVSDKIKYMTSLDTLRCSAFNCNTKDIPASMKNLQGESFGAAKVPLKGDIENLPTGLRALRLYSTSGLDVYGSLDAYLNSLQNLLDASPDFAISYSQCEGDILNIAKHFDIGTRSSSMWYLSANQNLHGDLADVAQWYSNARSQRLGIYLDYTGITVNGATPSAQRMYINWDASGNYTFTTS